MRERTPLPRSVIEQLPRLKLIASTGPRNAAIDVEAGGRKAGRVRYWQYGQAEKSPDLAISDLSRFLASMASLIRLPRE